MTYTEQDHQHMARALALAARGLYTTTPNPRVGCVIAKESEVLGEGWHQAAGLAHAEVIALRAAGERARGATLYATLEPCSHHGRTPPCTDALIAAGITRVVAAMQDPNPQVAGSGFARLGEAGIELASGLMEDDARELNIGFVSRMQRGRPWVRMKIAATLDGRTALANGQSQWITGVEARRDGHHFRARACAVLTGIGTVKDDDPQLSVRMVETTRQPLKVLVDSRLEVSHEARIFDGAPVLIATAVENEAKFAALRRRGAEVLLLPNSGGKVHLARLFEQLAAKGLNEIHVEAGAKLNGSLLREGCVDELLAYFAPAIVGDSGRGMFSLPELTDLGALRRCRLQEASRIGDDLRVIARF
jgi:diaminohydroxyphosphoribosylaminopyrimidine deaminase/5-amino-6-(5-phosphoribosylamino)uracil reductase